MKMNDMHLEITKTISKTLVSVILSKYCMFIQQYLMCMAENLKDEINTITSVSTKINVF